ncbi:MAG TPA: redoxin domain-containing protein [Ktedonobacterales bacterium]|jgi:peroxiredoxin (alkyl hydroperoxide reductase subunit C)|nr:redoxin domain-containing protein [Ktedonobacterales bacterium]
MADVSAPETTTLKVGDEAPDFTLDSATTNGSVTLSSFRGNKNVVLAFFPFAFSGTCSAQMPSYEAELDRFRSYDTEVIGISEDAKHSLAAWAKQIGVTFPLLSDFYPQGKVVDLYGVRHPAGMAERALIVVDKSGKVAWIHVHRPTGEVPDNEELFAVLRKLS